VYKITVVRGAGKGKVVWSEPEIIGLESTHAVQTPKGWPYHATTGKYIAV